jgi:hypothetical protein
MVADVPEVMLAYNTLFIDQEHTWHQQRVTDRCTRYMPFPRGTRCRAGPALPAGGRQSNCSLRSGPQGEPRGTPAI